MTICCKYVSDTTVNDIWFDDQGKCKYCFIHDEMEKLHLFDVMEKKRLNRITNQSDKVKLLYQQHADGKIHISKEIWKWIHTELWFRNFVD